MDQTSTTRVFMLAIRPKTLAASLSPVILGSALVPADNLQWFLVFCALGCALSLQVAVNFANDYFDAKHGIDTKQRLGPVRVSSSGLISDQVLKIWIATAILLAISFGMVLAINSSWLLIAIGALCIMAALAYSGGPYPLASHGLGEITVLIFFGWVAVGGSYYVHTLTINWPVFIIATALSLLLAAVMLVNNIRDITTDQLAGKNTLAVYLGQLNSRRLYPILLLSSGILHWLAVVPNGNLLLSVVPLLVSLPLAIYCCYRLSQATGAQLNPLLGLTALLGLCYAVTTAFTLIFFS